MPRLLSRLYIYKSHSNQSTAQTHSYSLSLSHKHTHLQAKPSLFPLFSSLFSLLGKIMGATLLPDLGTEILIPLCAVIGIAFSVVQWMFVSQVKLSPGRDANSNAPGKNGYNDYLIEEEEGGNDHNVVLKCAEIQNAISEGPFYLSCILRLSLALVDPTLFVFSI